MIRCAPGERGAVIFIKCYKGCKTASRQAGRRLAHYCAPDPTGAINARDRRRVRHPPSPASYLAHESQINNVLSVFRYYGINVHATNQVDWEFPDSDDIVFCEVKMSKDDAFLVTGNNKHFPRTPLVVTPSEMVEILYGCRSLDKV